MVMPCVFVIGNPGVGKSAICNTFGSDFKSGISIGKGLTTVMQICEVTINNRKCTIVDAPGLYEPSIERTRKNATEIKEGLSQPGAEYKIIFVLTLEAGRIKAHDMSMMKAVMEAIDVDKDQVAVVINKVHKDEMILLKEPGGLESLIQYFIEGGVKFNTKCMVLIEFMEMRLQASKSHTKYHMETLLIKLVAKQIKVTGNIELTEDKIYKMQLTMDNLKYKIEEQNAKNKELEMQYEKQKDNIKKMLDENRVNEERYNIMIKDIDEQRNYDRRLLWGIATLGMSEVVRFIDEL